jgi:hypothetical protein
MCSSSLASSNCKSKSAKELLLNEDSSTSSDTQPINQWVAAETTTLRIVGRNISSAKDNLFRTVPDATGSRRVESDDSSATDTPWEDGTDSSSSLSTGNATEELNNSLKRRYTTKSAGGEIAMNDAIDEERGLPQPQTNANGSQARLRNVEYPSEVDVASTNNCISTVVPLRRSDARQAFVPKVPTVVPTSIIPSDDISSIGFYFQNFRYDFSKMLQNNTTVDQSEIPPSVSVVSLSTEPSVKVHPAPKTSRSLCAKDRSDLELFFVTLIVISAVTLAVLLVLILSRS